MDENARIESYLKALYLVIWFNWYHDQPDATPATVIVEFADGDDGYDRDTHRMYFRISEANRDDILQGIRSDFNHRSDAVEWPVWYTALVHEMIHEYQFRVLNDAATAEGQTLFDNPPKIWDGPGHGVGFYSAIANRAIVLHMPAAELCKSL